MRAGEPSSAGRDLSDASDQNLWAAWRHFGRTAPRGSVEEDDDLIVTETGAPVATFNPAFVRRVPGTTLDDATALVRRAVDRDVPVVLTVNPNVPDVERLVEAGRATGLVETNHLPGMALADVRAEPRGVPRGLEIDVVDRPRDWASYFDVLCAGFDVPRDAVTPIAEPRMYSAANVTAIAGKVRGTMVVTSLAFVDGDVVGVYNVATHPAYRRRGYGEALTRAAIEWGRARGAAVAVLQASAMGRPIYERMGFRDVVPYIQLVVPA